MAKLQSLLKGHARFRQSRFQNLAAGQSPKATIVCCSDSRVAPEIIFDTDLGELFVIRVAGNVCQDDEIGSIEFSVASLKVPLVIVMGHTHCGAVTAAAEKQTVSDSFAKLLKNIVPSVEENIRQQRNNILTNSKIVQNAVQAGELQVIGILYDLKSGELAVLQEDT